MEKYILYGGMHTRAIINEMVLIEANLDYELRSSTMNTNLKRFVKSTPPGFVPVLITPQNQTIYETAAINLYLAEKHQITDLAPDIHEQDRGPFLSALFFITDELEPALKRLFYPHRYIFRDEDKHRMLALATQQVFSCLSTIDKQIKNNGPYRLGKRFSLIDITLSYWVCGFDPKQITSNYPSISNLLGLVRQRKTLIEVFKEIDRRRQVYAELQNQGRGAK